MMNSNEAHKIYDDLNDNGYGFGLTDSENALVHDEIAQSGLTVVADHGDELTECRDIKGHILLVAGDGRKRGAWAVDVTHPDAGRFFRRA
jgi:hypothetical protein